MNRIRLIGWLLGCCLTGFGQAAATGRSGTASDSSLTAEEARWVAWQQDLYEMGVSVQGDSMRVSPLVRRLFTDSLLRQQAYPATYTWPTAVALMQRMELKQAFWHLINLYPTDSASRTMVLQSVVAYNKMIDMNRAIPGSFYTYAFADPQIGRLSNGKPDIRHPDRLDAKMHSVRAIVDYLLAWRKTQPAADSSPARILLPGRR